MASLSDNIKYIFSTIKSSFLAAFILLCALVAYFSQSPYDNYYNIILHYVFLFVAAFTLLLLYLINRSKPFFSLFIGVTSYLMVNYLKNKYESEFVTTTEFQMLCLILPLNFVMLYFLPQSKLFMARNRYVLLFLLFQACFFQHFSYLVSYIPYINMTFAAMPLWAFILWIVLLTPLAIDTGLKKSFITIGLFYADSALFMGLLYANYASALTTFYLSFVLILLCTVFLDIYHRFRYDILEYVGSRNIFFSQANSKFPYKYSIILFSLDNRDKILQIFGARKMQALEQMIINRIREFHYEAPIYRYNENEYIMAFLSETAKHTKEFADNIRRGIATSEFIFTTHKSIKVTISVCVSEKTRIDKNAEEVLERAHKGLLKNHRFNGNITTIA